MTAPVLLLAALTAIYRPADWQFFPAMDEIRCVTTGPAALYVAVPHGVYVLDRSTYGYVRCLTRADGLGDDTRLCAWNQSRSELLVTAEDGLYSYLPATGVLNHLAPPFSDIRSIGIAPDAAWFDTEKGLFRKHRTADSYEEAGPAPDNTRWYGQRDTTSAEQFTFLTPWFIADDQLTQHRLTRAWRDAQGRRLFVAASDYGLLVYNLRSGLSEAHVRLGPFGSGPTRLTWVDNHLWLLGREQVTAVDTAENWTYRYTRAGDISLTNLRLLYPGVTGLDRSELLTAFLPESSALYLGTTSGLYLLGPYGKLTRLLRTSLPITALLKVRDTILVGTDKGLFQVVGETLFETHDPKGRADWGVYSIARTATGTTWLGVQGGVLALDANGNWHSYTPPGFDLSRPVQAVAASSRYAFIATNLGIGVYNTSDSSYTVLDNTFGLFQKEITGLWADDRYLWISSPGLLSRFAYTDYLK